MSRVKIKTRKGPSGLSEVKVLKHVVKVTFEDGETFEVALDKAPPEIQSGNFYIRMSADKDQIYDVRPWEGTFAVTFREFAHQKDQPPSPKVQPGGVRQKKGGGTFVARERLIFTAILDIVSKGEKYKGMSIPYILEYQFGDFDGLIGVDGYGKPARELEEFLKLAGVDWENDTTPFSDNVLPALEEVLQKASTTFMVKVEQGWPRELIAPPEGM